jgi:hypothetical protein
MIDSKPHASRWRAKATIHRGSAVTPAATGATTPNFKVFMANRS